MLKKADTYFWPRIVIILGLWESLAVSTHKVPTISAVIWHLKRNHSRETSIGVGIWLLAQGKHLLDGGNN